MAYDTNVRSKHYVKGFDVATQHFVEFDDLLDQADTLFGCIEETISQLKCDKELKMLLTSDQFKACLAHCDYVLKEAEYELGWLEKYDRNAPGYAEKLEKHKNIYKVLTKKLSSVQKSL